MNCRYLSGNFHYQWADDLCLFASLIKFWFTCFIDEGMLMRALVVKECMNRAILNFNMSSVLKQYLKQN